MWRAPDKRRSNSRRDPHIGSAFSDFLKEEGIYEEVTGHAIKRVLAAESSKR